jgi:3-(3-hydroxy-phenyl)propionate hydroxylase
MSGSEIEIEIDVIIIGCGPVGAVAANLLGSHGIRTLVLERDAEPHGMSRAISCDDESMRLFQRLGLADELRRDMREGDEILFTNGKGKTFADVQIGKVDFGMGHPSLLFYHQGEMERTLRAGLTRFPEVELRLGVEVVAIDQDAGGVIVTARDRATGAETRVRARYALACDGGRSEARRMAGIKLHGSRSEPWLTVTARLAPGEPPLQTRFNCDPRRPCFVAFIPPDYQRWELMLRSTDDLAEMEKPEKVRALIAPYIDPARVTIVRAAVYTFQNVVASTWRKGRLLLLGDAAHMMPPFMGQGLCSGFRDASNLVWKLVQVLRGATPDLLDTYESERRPHIEEMARVSTLLGHIFMARDPRIAFARDNLLLLLHRIPRVRRFIRDFEFKPLPAVERGFMTGGKRRSRSAPEGTMFLQPEVVDTAGRRVLLDELLGQGFAVIGMDIDPRAATPRGAHQFWDRLGTTFLQIRRAQGRPQARSDGQLEAVDVDGKLEAWFTRAGARLAVVRPDRFVFATGTAERGPSMMNELRAALGAGLS